VTYYTAIKRKEILTHVTTWRNLGGTCKVEEVSHKKINTLIPFECSTWSSLIQSQKVEWWLPGAWERGIIFKNFRFAR
jgi:hypothetical protein